MQFNYFSIYLNCKMRNFWFLIVLKLAQEIILETIFVNNIDTVDTVNG